MKRIMITFAWTVCVLTACDKNKALRNKWTLDK